MERRISDVFSLDNKPPLLLFLKIFLILLLVFIMLLCYGKNEWVIIVETPEEEMELEEIGHRVITAYSSSEDETDDTPFITAYNTIVRDGIVATNEFPIGTQLLIDNEVYVVEDRTNSRYSYLIDIWKPSKAEAMEWGRRVLPVFLVK